jgi:peptidoglycan/LPS O-acetylase OafA/YrhL
MSSQAHDRIAPLDGVRGIAILMVLLIHFSSRGWLVENSDSFAADLLVDIVFTGWTGVELFFVLSGFLITGILLDTRDDPHYFRNFYARRCLRIFPLYYAVLIVVLLMTTVFAGLLAKANFKAFDAVTDTQWLHWIYASNIAKTINPDLMLGPIGVFWSLAIEEHFYLFWPAVVYLLPRRALPWACAFLIVTSNLLRGVFIYYENVEGAYVFTFARLDGMALGALLAWGARDLTGGLVARRHLLWTAAALGLIGTLAVGVWRRGLYYQDPMVLLVGLPFIGLLCGSVVGGASIAQPGGWCHRVLGGKFLGFFGKYSYCMYLVHMPLAVVIWRLGLGHYVFGREQTVASDIAKNGVNIVLGIAITSAIAVVSWRVLEKPALSFKRYFQPTRG